MAMPPTAVPANRQHSVRRLSISLLVFGTVYQLHSNSTHFKYLQMTPQDFCSRATLPSTNCYHPHLLFELQFLRAKAECFARLCHHLGVCPSVRLSVCLSHSWAVSKQCKV